MTHTRITLLLTILCITCLSIFDSSAYYDPKAGKWLSRDPIQEKGGINTTSFCRNDPVNNVDPLGLEANKLYGGGQVYEPRGGWWGYSNLDPSMSPWILSSEFEHLDGTFYDFPGDMLAATGDLAILGTVAAAYYGPPTMVAVLAASALGPAAASATIRAAPTVVSSLRRAAPFVLRHGRSMRKAMALHALIGGGTAYLTTGGDPKSTAAGMASGAVVGPLYHIGTIGVVGAVGRDAISGLRALHAMATISGSGAVIQNTLYQVSYSTLNGEALPDALAGIDRNSQITSGLLGMAMGGVSGGLMLWRDSISTASMAMEDRLLANLRYRAGLRIMGGGSVAEGLGMYRELAPRLRALQSLTSTELSALIALEGGVAFAGDFWVGTLGIDWLVPRDEPDSARFGVELSHPDFPSYGQNTVWTAVSEIP